MLSSLFVCLSVYLLAKKLPNGLTWADEQTILVAIRITVWIHGLFSGFVTIGRYGKWYQPTTRSRRFSARHALTGIAIATMTSLRHRPTTDGHDRRALAEVCTVTLLPV